MLVDRGVIHSWATDKDDPTVMPRWGKVGKQKIVDEGPLVLVETRKDLSQLKLPFDRA